MSIAAPPEHFLICLDCGDAVRLPTPAAERSFASRGSRCISCAAASSKPMCAHPTCTNDVKRKGDFCPVHANIGESRPRRKQPAPEGAPLPEAEIPGAGEEPVFPGLDAALTPYVVAAWEWLPLKDKLEIARICSAAEIAK